MFVDAAGDVAVEVRQQNAAVAKPDDADRRWRRVDGGLVWSLVGLTLDVHGRLIDVTVTACSDVDVVCLTRCSS